MARKFKLEYSPDYEFLLLGIVSFEKDYRISWEINEKLHMDFVRVDDHRIHHERSGQEQLFSCFIFEDDNTCLDYKLLSNRSDLGSLIEELKNIDYLLVVTGEYFQSLADQLKKNLLGLESVQSCFILQPENIKASERVL